MAKLVTAIPTRIHIRETRNDAKMRRHAMPHPPRERTRESREYQMASITEELCRMQPLRRKHPTHF